MAQRPKWKSHQHSTTNRKQKKEYSYCMTLNQQKQPPSCLCKATPRHRTLRPHTIHGTIFQRSTSSLTVQHRKPHQFPLRVSTCCSPISTAPIYTKPYWFHTRDTTQSLSSLIQICHKKHQITADFLIQKPFKYST